MKTFQRIKIYKGNYEIRQYEWEHLLKSGQNAKFALGDFDGNMFIERECMYVTLNQIRKMEVVNMVTGSQSGESYLMRSIKWKAWKPKVTDDLHVDPNVLVGMTQTKEWELLRKRFHPNE